MESDDHRYDPPRVYSKTVVTQQDHEEEKAQLYAGLFLLKTDCHKRLIILN